MIGSLFKELPPIQETEVSELAEELLFETDSDDSIIAALPMVQKIVSRRGLLFWQSEASDLVQGIFLRLLNWRNKYRAKSEEMSEDEWQSFVAKTAYNEINRHYLNKNGNLEVGLESVQEILIGGRVEGQTETEFRSLVRHIWQRICSLSLRQRQALVLGSQDLVNFLLRCEITDQELAESLNLTITQWSQIKNRLPLKNFQIARLLKETGNPSSLDSITKSIKKARYEARLKVQRLTEK